LALLRPEGSLAEPLERALSRLMGWLAAVVPVWLAGLSALILSRRESGRPWPALRLGTATTATLSLLALGHLEALRRTGEFVESGGGGLLGRTVAESLIAWFGVASAAGLSALVLLTSTFVLTGVTSGHIVRAAVLAWRAAAWATRAIRGRATRPRLRINAHEHRDEAHHHQTSAAGDAHPYQRPRGSAATDDRAPEGAGDPAGGAQMPTEHMDASWRTPPLTLFQTRAAAEPVNTALREQARIIEETLASFNIEVRVVEANQGPAVTQYGLEPAVGVPVSRITARLNDLALRLGASPIRVEAPVPGRRMVGIEVPNPTVSIVRLRDVLEAAAAERARARIPLALGKDIAGKPKIVDLARMPHLLIAGATGSGKSVCINSIVACLLAQFTPDQLRLLMIDPKMVELAGFNGVPHLRMPVVTDMERVVGTLKWATQEMERRYKLFASHSARNIDGYNRAASGRGERPLPNLVLIIDELADLMMTAPEEVEKTICRLAQLARATGIHLVVATQRPSVDVITGLIKANFPTRIAFAVTSQVDSRVILDTVGAEQLLGRGDMLYLPPDSSKPIRLQGTYVSDQEIEALVAYWRGFGEPRYDDRELAEVESLGRAPEPVSDDLYERAAALARESGRMSVSLLQRRLGVGYPRAARLLDLLQEHGVVSTAQDGRGREVLTEARSPDRD